jgi:hypothetical protein
VVAENWWRSAQAFTARFIVLDLVTTRIAFVKRIKLPLRQWCEKGVLFQILTESLWEGNGDALFSCFKLS